MCILQPSQCEHVRYCHLELIFFIILFLCGMLLKQVPYLLKWFCLITLLDLVCDGHSWYGSPQICSHILLGNRLLQATLCSWFAWSREYLKLSRISIYLSMAFKSYPLPYAYLVWNWSSISFLYTTENYLYILLVHDKRYSQLWWNL